MQQYSESVYTVTLCYILCLANTFKEGSGGNEYKPGLRKSQNWITGILSVLSWNKIDLEFELNSHIRPVR